MVYGFLYVVEAAAFAVPSHDGISSWATKIPFNSVVSVIIDRLTSPNVNVVRYGEAAVAVHTQSDSVVADCRSKLIIAEVAFVALTVDAMIVNIGECAVMYPYFAVIGCY